jgi:hypothetical protein
MRRLLSLFFFFFALSSAPALAQPSPKEPQSQRIPAGKVQLDVLVIHATNSHSSVDQRVSKYLKYLKHLAYTGYSPLNDYSLMLSLNRVERFDLAGGRKVVVELLQRDERRARLRIQIIAPKGGKLLDTTMSVSRNASVIVAGPRYKDGILVLPLTARY